MKGIAIISMIFVIFTVQTQWHEVKSANLNEILEVGIRESLQFAYLIFKDTIENVLELLPDYLIFPPDIDQKIRNLFSEGEEILVKLEALETNLAKDKIPEIIDLTEALIPKTKELMYLVRGLDDAKAFFEFIESLCLNILVNLKMALKL